MPSIASPLSLSLSLSRGSIPIPIPMLELDGQAVGQLGPRLDGVWNRFSPHHVGTYGRGGEDIGGEGCGPRKR